MPNLTVIHHTRSQPWGYGHHPRGSRMQQRIHIDITRPLISTHKLIDQISTIYCTLDIQEVLGISVQTWRTQRSSPPRSQTSVRQALRCKRRPASNQTTRYPPKGPTCRARRYRRPPSPLLPSPLAPGPLRTSKILSSSPSSTREACWACLQENNIQAQDLRESWRASPQPFGEHARQAQQRMACEKRCLHKPSHSRA